MTRSVSIARWTALLLITVGGGVSGYLLARSFALLSGTGRETFDACSVVFGTNCDSVLRSESSWVLGIPLAGWGVVYFATLACLVLLGWFLRDAFERESALAALLLAAVGVAVSIALSLRLLSGGEPLCPLCLAVHGLNLALLPALKGLTGRRFGELIADLRSAGRYLIGRETGSSREAASSAWKVVGLVNAALVAVVAYQWVFVEATLRAAASEEALDPQEVIAVYESLPRQNVPVRPDDPRLGPIGAPVRLVVFSSFQCPGCRRLATELRPLSEQFGAGLVIAFKHYPLSSQCNPRLEEDRHPHACEAAWAAEAAHRQGKFWPFHDSLFASSPPIDEKAVRQVAERLGLEDITNITNGPPEDGRPASAVAKRIAEKVAADVELGTRLEIPATPAVFLNGRAVYPARASVLEILIRHELEKSEGPAGSAQAISPAPG